MAIRTKAKKTRVTELGGETPTNGAEETIEMTEPYTVDFILEGVTPILFNRWNCEVVEAKANAAKGSKAKKSDDVPSKVYRDAKGFICVPSEHVRMSMVTAAKFRQDPRSPRKSAMDLFKAAIVPDQELASLGVKDYYEDKRRVVVQRNAISRTRPGIKEGWKARFQFTVLLPEYVTPAIFHEVLINAGRLIGLGDFRPTYGRFQVTKFGVIES